jgi:hypothetical protein
VQEATEHLDRYVNAAAESSTERRAILRLRLLASAMEGDGQRELIAGYLRRLGDPEGAAMAARCLAAGPVDEEARQENLAKLLQRPIREIDLPGIPIFPPPSGSASAETGPELPWLETNPTDAGATGIAAPIVTGNGDGHPPAHGNGKRIVVRGPGHALPAHYAAQGFPSESGRGRWILHMLIALGGWGLYVERWSVVLGRTSLQFMWLATLEIALGIAIILELTIHWIGHNQRIAARGKRGYSSRYLAPRFETDVLDRRIELPAEPFGRMAPLIQLNVQDRIKSYSVPGEPIRPGLVQPAGGPWYLLN